MKRTLNELLTVLPCVQNFEAWAESLPYPKTVGGHAVKRPDELTLSQYLDLSNVDADSLLFAVPRIMLGQELPDEVLLNADSEEVVGLVWGVKDAVEKLNEAFKSIQPDLTDEEKQAGPPEFGVMGLIDYASRRFGKTYDEAEKLNVWHVFQALKIENETAEYKKRLQTIYQNKR